MKNNTKDIADEWSAIGASLPLALNRKNPYVVPEAYFEGFADTMLLKLGRSANNEAREELEALSPLLSSLKKDTAFTVPAGYFNTLSADIGLLEITEAAEPGARVIRMNTNRNRNIFRYAVAAAVVGVLGFSMFFWWGNDTTPVKANGNYASGLLEVPDDALAGFLLNTPDVHRSEFVDSNDTVFFDHALLTLGDENELASMLTTVPDNDLNDYDKDLL